MDLNDLQALMGESPDTDDHRDFWVIGLDGLCGDLLGEARRLADSLGAYVHCVGPADAAEAIACGADRLHPLEAAGGDETVSALGALFAGARPEFILLPASALGDEVAGRLAQQLGGGALYNCIALKLDESTREITGTYPVYDGAYYLDVAVTVKPAIFTIGRGKLPQPYRDFGRTGEVMDRITAAAGNRIRVLGPAGYAPNADPLRNAARVMAIGRAGNDAESVAVARQIAFRIGAQVAGDRSAFDSGWITHDQIVGVIGTEIAPDLYIAAGIWGDTLHRVGVEGARFVVAIHPDKNAPIFGYADACIVGRPKDVLPELLAQLDQTGGAGVGRYW